MSEQEMREQCEWECAMADLVGPPTPEEHAEWVQAEIEYIDHQMLMNAV